MAAIEERIQADLWWFGWLAFAVALPLFALLRQRDPLIRWHEDGNVPTKPFKVVDLVLVIAFFLGWKVVLTMFGEEGKAADGESSRLALILTDMLVKVALGSFFLYWLMIRKVNVVEAFGLGRLTIHGVMVWGGVVSLLAVPLVLAVGEVAARALSEFLGELSPQPIVRMLTESRDVVFRGTAIVSLVLVAPVFEELFYRGYLYGVTKRFSDRFFAAVFSSLMFTMAHTGVISVLPIFTLAVFFVLAYELSGSLWVPIVVHSLFNVVNLVLLHWTKSGG